MKIEEKDIIRKTHYGLNIYSHVLRQYYPDEIVISLSGKKCKAARNPFKDSNETLNIYLRNWVFIYEDVTDNSFKGNPFSFAALHYKLSGDELLQKLNEELHLHIGENQDFYRNKLTGSYEKTEIVIPKCSYFKCPVSNTLPEKEVDLKYIGNLIKYDQFKNQTEKLRSISNPKEARAYKAQNFDYVTFSGTFTKRNDKALINHSGLITIDFDRIKDILKLKNALLQDEYFNTELMFVSPSGNGLKWIIPIDLSKVNHQDYFKAVSNYIQHTYNLKVDKSGKDISRACFLPYDKHVYINPKYLQ